MDKKKIELIAVAVIFGTLGIVLLKNFISMPASGPPQKGVEAPASIRERLMKAEMMVKRLPQQRAEVGELQDTADVRVKDIPRALDHTWLSRQISLAAGETGVSDVSQRIVSGAAPLKMDKELQEKFSEKIWEVRLRGDYHEVGKFLNKLEGANAFLEVTDINVEGNDPGGQKVAVTLRYLVKKEGTGG